MAEDNGSGIGWFLAGLGLGALVGVLFAPKAGEETREYIANRANEGADYLKNSSQQARDSWSKWVDQGKQQVQSAYDAGRRAYRESSQSEPQES